MQKKIEGDFSKKIGYVRAFAWGGAGEERKFDSINKV